MFNNDIKLIFLIMIILCFIYQYIYINKSNIENFNSCIINTCKTGYTKSNDNLSCIIPEKILEKNPLTVSTDGNCGPKNSNKKCPSGLCCSPSGYCGGSIGTKSAWCNATDLYNSSNNNYDGDPETVVETVAISSTKSLTTETIYSQNKRYYIKFIDDGNLALFDKLKPLGVIWHTDTSYTGITEAFIQSDGNFVLQYYLWNSNTSSTNGPFKLLIQDDGNLVLYDKFKPLWSSGTNSNSKIIEIFNCAYGFTKSADKLSCVKYDGTCGPKNSNKICAKGLCCNSNG